jgi:hypothetical protein
LLAEKMHDQMVLNVDAVIKPLMLKDLRIQCRARGLNPGGEPALKTLSWP